MKCASWKQASFRHKISIVNYNYGGFQDETISGAARRASIQRAVFPAAAEVADAGSHGRAPSHIQPRIQRPGTWEVRASTPTLLFVFSMLEADAGSIRRLSRVICSWVKIMGSGNMPEPYFLRRNRILQYLWASQALNNSITILITNGERLIGNERETQDRITRAKARNMCICNKNPTLTSEILV